MSSAVVVLENLVLTGKGSKSTPAFTADLIVDEDTLAHLESDGEGEVTFRWRIPASDLEDYALYQTWMEFVDSQPPLDWNGQSFKKDETTVIFELVEAGARG